jgi:rfaE bifunctional protein nucleotidyltransferase chain/domain
MIANYLQNYSHKVISVADLKNVLDNKRSEKKTILCHGVFDVVHPGHLRHLAFAKTKADILIVSVTSDSHIKKGAYRPHVPENMRALNLAALEMVDYVIIDINEKPLSVLEELQPDFFAKGFEYSNSELNPATREEEDVIRKYGGQVLFTPGDYVLSSSKLITESLPNLMIEKLLLILQSFRLTFKDLTDTLDSLTNFKVHVVGDTIVDVHTETSIFGGQTKTPTLSVKFLEEHRFVGGAAIVAKHLKAAGAEVEFTTILGQDANAVYVREDLRKVGITLNDFSENKRPTTEKKAIVCDGYRLLKVDTVENAPCAEDTIQEISAAVRNSNADIVIFSDFRHGIFNKKSIPTLIKSIPADALKIADSQVASRWGNICDFARFDLITPNEREARFSTADQDSTIGPLANKLYEISECKNLILKLGSRGAIALMESEPSKGPKMLSIDSLTSFAMDPVGAGDAMIAYASLALKATESLPIALILGSIAAACETELDGNIPIDSMRIREKIQEIKNLTEYKTK